MVNASATITGMFSPVADRMGVAQYVMFEEISVHFDEALGVKCATHIIDIGFTSKFETRKVSPSERVQNPG